MEWIPIPSHPGNARALGLLPRAEARHERLLADSGTPAVEDTRVSEQEISVSLAASLGLGSIFQGQVTGNETGYWLDAMAYTDQFEEGPPRDGLVLATRFGFGLRVMFRVKVTNFKGTLSYGMLGAAISANFATATYEINGPGLGVPALGIILGGIAQTGALDSDTFYKINSIIVKNLVTYITAHLAELKPVRVAALVQTVLIVDSLNISQAVLYAMRQISAAKSLQDALSGAGDLDPSTIRFVYSNILGAVPDTTTPTKPQAEKADEWLADN